ncbi:MAG TPA: 4a-hydroxytetrahydrobiopterin dehydratase [Ignavibacteria bacterium]
MKSKIKKEVQKISTTNQTLKIIQKKGWKVVDKSIVKIFKTKNFPQTMALVSGICGLCQQHDHHPDYLTLKYAEVKVSFSTHTAGGITEKDINIAKEIDTML